MPPETNSSFFYLCRAVSNSAKKGPFDYNIPVVYTLSFLSFDIDFGEGCDEVVQYLSVSNDLHPEVRYDIMHMVYVRLARFDKREEDCRTALDRLIFSLKNTHRLPEKPKSFDETELGDIFESAKISNFNSEELMDYETLMKYHSDTVNAFAYAEKKGEIRGRKEGMEEGETIGMQKGMERAFALLRQGYSIDEAEKEAKAALRP
uniref:Uncharacterized protein n=1 Tax=uncultured bacterium contig00028 TaxID=1181517 RepID=A0A806KIQ6_9BACT|nr:conserved hypothetical protein [uncultured bacterium contig00028]